MRIRNIKTKSKPLKIPAPLYKKICLALVRATEKEKIFSINSASTYATYIVDFTAYLGENDFFISQINDTKASFKSLLEFADREIAIDYLKTLVRNGAPKNTVETALKAINIWMRDCQSARYLKNLLGKNKYREQYSTSIRLSEVSEGNEFTLNHLTRTYTTEQLNIISQHVNKRNAFSILLCTKTGIRVKELYTIKRLSEYTEDFRELTGLKEEAYSKRFLALPGEKYVVDGKGGHKRIIIVPFKLAKELENRRLNKPKVIYDRNIRYTPFYDIAGGNALSKSFDRASKRWLGWGTGIHSLRHDFAKYRFKTLFKVTNDLDLSRAIVSQ